MKVILIAAALAPLTLSPVNSSPLSDGEFARVDDVSKIFIAVGASRRCPCKHLLFTGMT